VLQGSFDRYVQETKRKRGTGEVDAEFLKEIEGWRDTLARNVALRNPDLSVHELNFAVQRTVDRIIFLRMCEDRGIEEYGRLLALTGGPHIYARMGDLYRQAEEKYNSGIFDFQADTLSKRLTVDDKVLKPILAGLYYPQSPYEFSVLPPEVLGQVYEQFLGKVIRLTPAHRAKVEEKPEVKKAGGVYYTPTYIVDYIVQQTVGRLVAGKTPRQISKLRILDPACGSGSFLLGAYQYLLDYHRQWYEDHDPARYAKGKRPAVYQAPLSPPLNPPQLWGGSPLPLGPPQPWGGSGGGEWRLTTAEKKRILLNNIYGVDIDRQAVEVTKLSLLLKVLEGENQETLGRQLALWRERALPDLGDNVKCGNSLIGPDYYEGQQLAMFDEEEMRRVNPFDWQAGFPEIMKADGFDVVIGNPPYIFARGKRFTNYEKGYFKKYKHQTYQLHTFALFTEQGFYLLRKGGYLGYIIPNNWLSISTLKPFRDFVVGSTGELTIINNMFKVFPGANVDTSIIIFQKIEPTHVYLAESHQPGEVSPVATVHSTEVLADSIIQYRLYKNPAARSLLKKIEAKAIDLQAIAIVKAGLKAYETGKGNPVQTDAMKKGRVYHARGKLDHSYRLYLDGKDVKRYATSWSGQYLKYGPNLAAPRDPKLFEGERILVRQIPSRPPYSINAAIVSGEELNDINSMIVRAKDAYSLKYILGILNSRLLTFWFDYKFDKFQRAIFPQFKVNELTTFPICCIDFSDPTGKAQHDRMVQLVERTLALHRKLAAATVPPDKELYQRQIEATDRQIDRLVYELYGLTEEEITIVEGV